MGRLERSTCKDKSKRRDGEKKESGDADNLYRRRFQRPARRQIRVSSANLAPYKEIDYFQHPAKLRLKQIETVKKNLQCRRLPAVHAVGWIDNIVVEHHPPDEEDQQRRDEEVREARPEHPKFLERI